MDESVILPIFVTDLEKGYGGNYYRFIVVVTWHVSGDWEIWLLKKEKVPILGQMLLVKAGVGSRL